MLKVTNIHGVTKRFMYITHTVYHIFQACLLLILFVFNDSRF